MKAIGNLIFNRLIFFIIFLLLIIYWIIGTNSGLKTLAWVASKTTPQFQYKNVEGTLLDGFSLNDINLKTDLFQMKAERLQIKLNLRPLLTNVLEIPNFSIENGNILFLKNIKGSNESKVNEGKSKPIIINHATGSIEWHMTSEKINIVFSELKGSYQGKPLQGHTSFQFIKGAFKPNEMVFSLENHQFFLSKNKSTDDLQFELNIKPNEKISLHATGTLNALEELNAWQGKIEKMSIDSTFDSSFSSHWVLNEPALIKISPSFISVQTLHLSNKDSRFPATLALNFQWDKEKGMNGHFNGKINDLKMLYRVFPQISKLVANLEIEGSISGKFDAPVLQLKAVALNTSFYLPKEQVAIQKFNLSISGSYPGYFNITGTGNLSGRSFSLTGKGNPFKPGGDLELTLSGKELRIYNTNDINIIASPTLNINYSNHKLSLTGEVHILGGHISIKQGATSLVTSHDVTFVEKNQENKPKETVGWFPKIMVYIDPKFRYKGYGLDTKVGGTIEIERREDGLLTGNGQLTLTDGRYLSQGRMHYIKRGRFLYPIGTLLNNPILDILLSQRPIGPAEANTESGIYIQGTLKKPSYHLYSNGGQNSEVLSRLGLPKSESSEDDRFLSRSGIPGGDTSEKEQRQVLSRTAFLLAGKNPLIQSIQNRFGFIEEFGIESRETHKLDPQGGVDTMLLVGMSLSKRLYLQFLQSLLEPTKILRIRYILSPRFALNLETGTEEELGADLIYAVEKD